MKDRDLPRSGFAKERELRSKFFRSMGDRFNVMANLLPQTTSICSNRVRACILHLMVNSPDTLHSMQVEEMAFRIGVRPRTIVYHLEKLRQWKLVDVKKAHDYGGKKRRSIWGLDLDHRDWIIKCYNNITTHFFVDDELDEMTNRNRTFRKRNADSGP